MVEYLIEQVSLEHIDTVYPETMLSLFWERGPETIHRGPLNPDSGTASAESEPAGSSVDSDLPTGDGISGVAAQIRLEKEAWLNSVFLSWGPCGYSLRRRSPRAVEGREFETVGTLLFAPPRFCPTSFSMPSGPISPEAIALTSLHYDPLTTDSEMLRALIATTLHKLALRGVSVVEAYGCSQSMDSTLNDLDSAPSIKALDDGPESLSGSLIAGFEEQLEETLNPKSCVSDALSAINHEAGDLIRTRTLIDAGFRVVTPHPVHPKLRIELDAELDWDEEVSHALERNAKESFTRAKMFIL